MNIGTIHFYNRSFPPEIRLEKESRAMIRAGHTVTVLTQRMSDKEPAYEVLEPNFFVVRASIKKPGIGPMVLSRFTFINREYIAALDKFIHEHRPDVLHVHEFNQVPTVLRVAEKHKIPVIADLHENMAAAHVAYCSEYSPLKKTIYSLLYNYHIWRWYEAKYLPRCYRVLVVVPEAAEVISSLGVPDDKIVVVCNTEDETTFRMDPGQADSRILDAYRDYWMVSYIGGVGPHRGLDTTLKSLPYLAERISNFKLVIVGAKDNQKREIFSEAESLNVRDQVEVVGWQPFERVNSYVMASRVCLVPHNDFEHTHTTIPHKLFQYMICSRPVLVSDCRPLKRVVEESGAGIVFQANNPKDLADKLGYMHKNPDKMKTMGDNGKKAALGKYAWRHDARKLLEMYSACKNAGEKKW